jgi:hypothetical protein
MDITTLSILLGIVVSVVSVASYFNHSMKDNINNAIVPAVLPLQNSIKHLEKSISKFETSVDILDKKQHELEKKFILMQSSLDALHKRMDEMDTRIRVFTNYCREQHKVGELPMSVSVYDAIVTGSRNRKTSNNYLDAYSSCQSNCDLSRYAGKVDENGLFINDTIGLSKDEIERRILND